MALDDAEPRGATPPPPPPPPPPPSVETRFFTLRLVDDAGGAIAGISVDLECDGNVHRHTTDGAGAVSGSGAETTAHARVVDEAKLRAALEPRWAKPRPRNVPVGADVHVRKLKDATEGVTLYDRRPATVVLVPEGRARCAQITGLMFDINLCFLLPSAIASMRTVVSFYERYAPCEVLVVGHTDSDGDITFNNYLSLERSKSIVAYLTDDVDAWLPYFKIGDARQWHYREVQHMLSQIDAGGGSYYPVGRAHGQLDATTMASLKRYQADRGLAATGTRNAPTERALVADYMALDGTTLPSNVLPTAHGCGQHFPAKASPLGASCAENRRVELFFFEDGIVPRPSSALSRPGSPEYPAWVSKVTDTAALRG